MPDTILNAGNLLKKTDGIFKEFVFYWEGTDNKQTKQFQIRVSGMKVIYILIDLNNIPTESVQIFSIYN